MHNSVTGLFANSCNKSGTTQANKHTLAPVMLHNMAHTSQSCLRCGVCAPACRWRLALHRSPASALPSCGSGCCLLLATLWFQANEVTSAACRGRRPALHRSPASVCSTVTRQRLTSAHAPCRPATELGAPGSRQPGAACRNKHAHTHTQDRHSSHGVLFDTWCKDSLSGWACAAAVPRQASTVQARWLQLGSPPFLPRQTCTTHAAAPSGRVLTTHGSGKVACPALAAALADLFRRTPPQQHTHASPGRSLPATGPCHPLPSPHKNTPPVCCQVLYRLPEALRLHRPQRV